ncbi:MAG TPA: phage portal protein, partial [Vicinamibacterales bacterium]|nr:phage portal protein [Vicinamibacterales bacterium]
LETREFDLREVANWFGVPPHRLGDATRTSYNSLEQENLSYLTGTLMRWVTRWEGEFWAKLLSEDEKLGDTHVVTFLRQSLVQADMSARNTAYKTALAGMPYMTIDEVRAREDLNPLPDGTGAKLLVPANIGSKGGASEPEPPSRTAGDPEAARAVLTETVRRFVRRLHGQVERALRRPGGLGKWVEKLEREELAACHGMLDDAIRAVAAEADVGAVVGLIFQAVRAAMAGNDTGALADLELTLPERVLESIAGELIGE